MGGCAWSENVSGGNPEERAEPRSIERLEYVSGSNPDMGEKTLALTPYLSKKVHQNGSLVDTHPHAMSEPKHEQIKFQNALQHVHEDCSSLYSMNLYFELLNLL
eukprot:scaffold148606_cov56-Attheya_sp.AAC.1